MTTQQPFAPAVKALQQAAIDYPAAAALIKRLLAGELRADAHHAAVREASDLIAPLGGDTHVDNANLRLFLKEAFRLGTPEPEIILCKHCGQEIAGAGVEHSGHRFQDAEHLAAWLQHNKAVGEREAAVHGSTKAAPKPKPSTEG